jgi:hypothetical protein
MLRRHLASLGRGLNPVQRGGSSREDAVTIQLSGDEALVLFDWIGRFNENGESTFHDQAEERVLWIIEGSLEKVLVAPFAGNYRELLSQARDRLRYSED